MKIFHISSINHPAISRLIELQRQDHQVWFVRLVYDNSEKYKVVKNGNWIEIKGIRKVFDQEGDERLRDIFDSLLKDYKPDLIHVHVFSGMSLPSILNPASSLGIRKVLTLHDHSLFCIKGICHNGVKKCVLNSVLQCDCRECREHSLKNNLPLEIYNKLRHERIKSILVQCEAIICPSHHQKRTLENLFGTDSRFRVVYHGVYLPIRKTRKTKRSEVWFGYIGTLDEAKGITKLLKAKDLLDDLDFRILICTQNTKNRLIESLRKDERIVLIEDVPREELYEKFFSKVDYLIVPSIWEETG
ncbi:MAG: hypothetical protein DRN25_03595, partial [Thermoplasmata archaeon]